MRDQQRKIEDSIIRGCFAVIIIVALLLGVIFYMSGEQNAKEEKLEDVIPKGDIVKAKEDKKEG